MLVSRHNQKTTVPAGRTARPRVPTCIVITVIQLQALMSDSSSEGEVQAKGMLV